MKVLRQVHLYLGCLFAPLVIYFAVSGSWQMFRLNDLPKDQPASAFQSALYELSKPHTKSTLPGLNPKHDPSTAFKWFALFTGLGLTMTSAIGIVLAIRFGRSKQKVFWCVSLGILLPLLMLMLRL